jgi:hypothetical protein
MSRTFVLGCLAFAASVALGIAYPPVRFPEPSGTPAPRTQRVVEAPAPGNTPASTQPTSTLGQSAAQAETVATTVPLAVSPAAKGITAVWANDGGDKVTRDELRTITKQRRVQNSIWDGGTIRLFGAKNEVIGFNLAIEAEGGSAGQVQVSFDRLRGPDGSEIRSSRAADARAVFDWRERDIELFFVRYLPIAGLSRLSYDTYDEQHVPERFRLPANARKSWENRPDHDKEYPDIAVPMELVKSFEIEPGHNQSVWVDIYIPKNAASGTYTGEVVVQDGTTAGRRIPVELRVRNFILPDVPAAKTMVATSYHDVAKRYTAQGYPSPGTGEDELTRLVLDRQMLLAHRHKISLIDDNSGADTWPQDSPRPEWGPRLSGALFTARNGYRGPGEGVGNNVFSIGTYGQWHDWWGPPTRASLWSRTDKWESWFAQNAPDTERFLYLADESDAYGDLERWSRWIGMNPGPGGKLQAFATADLLKARELVPSLGIVASWFRVGITAAWQKAVDQVQTEQGKRFYLYNGVRPASGSFAIEDDGVSLRELAWGQHKKKIDRWFFWNATYYDDFQGQRGPTDVFANAQTFGGKPTRDPSLGLTGWNYSNGDGLLFYPGMDALYPARSYNLEGPIASLRLKLWRRGIQDVDYLALAEKVNPQRTRAIIERMVPKVLWEYGVGDPSDPTWVRTPISWSTNPDDWEAARRELADIIENGGSQ